MIRHGQVLMSHAARVDGWQNLRDRDAMLFWIVSPATALASQPSDELWGELI